MKRFYGDPLPPNPRIAVIANDALGNFVVATPLLQMLRTQYPGCQIIYFGGARTRELQISSPLVDHNIELWGDPASGIEAAIGIHKVDLAINLEDSPLAKTVCGILGQEAFICGPCMGPGGRGSLPFSDEIHDQLWVDPNWIDPALTHRYPFLKSGFIAEIFCRLAFLEGPVPPYLTPAAEAPGVIPAVLLAVSASLPEKLWPSSYWQEAIAHLKSRGHTVGLLGAKPSIGKQHWTGNETETNIVEAGVEDLRGKFTLPQVVGALSKAKLVLTLDNGILHLAVSAETPTIGLFRFGIHRLWAPAAKNLSVIHADADATVAEIAPNRVIREINHVLP